MAGGGQVNIVVYKDIILARDTSRSVVLPCRGRERPPPGSLTMSSPGDWYQSLPPVCKAWGTACFACTLFSQFGLVDLRNLYLDWALVSSKFHVWRLLTNFCFLGKFSFPFLMRMMMM